MSENIAPEYVCVRCAQKSPTCCRLGGAGQSYGGEDCFPLSKNEAKRIEQAIAQAEQNPRQADAALLLQVARNAVDAPSGAQGWAACELNSAAFVESICSLFPRDKKQARANFPLGQTHQRLALTTEGACVFLSASGCVLPHEARPWFCRIFPFWVQGKAVQCFQDENCLAVQENSRDFMALMQSFGSSKQEIAALFSNLRDDWGLGT